VAALSRTWVRWLTGVPVSLYLASGALATARSLSAPRLEVRPRSGPIAPGSVVQLRVQVPARVETRVGVELVQGPRRRAVAERMVPRSPWAFWNHRWKSERFLIPVEAAALNGLDPAAATLRVSAQPGPVWLWQQKPVVLELPVAIGR
jgi:hypothetical protein